jgi:hypothetical protein
MMFLAIAADHPVHPIHLSQWKQQQLDGASELPAREGSQSLETTAQRRRGDRD